jgi:hypothetical protein
MSHMHWCDFAGHEWRCEGYATRMYDTEPSPCVCVQHGVSMEAGDHIECSIELLACPEHRDEQRQAMGWTPGEPWPPTQAATEESTMFLDKDGNHIVGFCLWCNANFYSMEEHEAHIANNSAACPVFQELMDEHCMPPVLQSMLYEAGEPNDKEKE